MLHVKLWVLVMAFLAIFIPATLSGQVTTATIYGTVTDPSGGAVSGGEITATNELTGASWQTTSSAAGDFTFTFLPVGRYTVVIRAAGFREERRTGLELGAGQQLRLSYSLALGQMTEVVTVTAETPLLNTANAEQNHTVNTLRITELPAINRDWSVLLNLGAGITVSNNAVSINGLPPDGFRFTVDGAAASGSGENETMAAIGYIKAVSLEAIREVTVTGGIGAARPKPASLA